jgi:hypothetical protein
MRGRGLGVVEKLTYPSKHARGRASSYGICLSLREEVKPTIIQGF